MSKSNFIQIRLGGYGPAATGISKALQIIGEPLTAEYGDALDIKYVFNIMDFGYRSEDILWLVETGVLSLGYQSSSYLTDRVPELGLVDLPFLFADRDAARGAMDGALGATLAQAIEDKADYRIVGWFENGFRHISNRLRPVRSPADLAGMTIRVLPSEIHKCTFALLGAVPQRLDLTEALGLIAAGKIDAQENPLANTVTYGAHRFHPFHTLTGHFYISRPIFICRAQFDSWPNPLQEAMRRAAQEAVTFQRELAIEEELAARRAIEAQGCRIEELTAAEHDGFARAVAPMMAEARAVYGTQLLRHAGR
jgi:TRAP-type C4-dicarboxylate transport system substrate-binding protein